MALTFPQKFPAGSRPPVVAAQASAERAFRKDTACLNEDDDSYQESRDTAASNYVIAVFESFAHQDREVARTGQLPADQVDVLAEDFIMRLAWHGREHFDPPLFGCPDPQYGWSEDTSWFDEVHRAITSSPAWDEHLAELAKVATQTPPSAPPSPPISIKSADQSKFPKRAAWLHEQMGIRDVTKNRLSEIGGPDRKTIGRVLQGLPVTEDSLEKLARALSEEGESVIFNDFPSD